STKKRLIVRQASSLKLSPIQKEKPLLTKKNTINKFESKLEKKDSDLNLLPTDLQKNINIISDESIFEREKRMVVILVSCNIENPSQLVLIDVDLASANFGKIICRLNLPLPGEELIVPVPSHSRIYILKLMDATINNGSDNGSLKTQKQTNSTENSSTISTHIRIQKVLWG
uniref:DUF4457 domain-containing protein n=1 Tax=Meloidogyne hapla TaxID=6305 RepID=A0A1I8AYX1_MELHA